MDETLRKRIAELVSKNDVLLFMKGTRHFPQCGFSSQVVGILNELGPKYETVNILAEAELRDGMKEFSSWPTFPQLYVKGSFVGGCDIVREMHANGELGVLFGAEAPKPPKIAVTEGAARAFKDALSDAGQDVLRLEITPEFQYDLHVGPREPSDIEIQTDGGVTLFVEAASARRADGLRIDFVTNGGGGFKLDNPNEPPRVKTMDVEGLKSWLDIAPGARPSSSSSTCAPSGSGLLPRSTARRCWTTTSRTRSRPAIATRCWSSTATTGCGAAPPRSTS